MVPFISKDIKLFEKIPEKIKIIPYILAVFVILIITTVRLKTILGKESINWNKFPVDACKFIEKNTGGR